MYTSNTGAPRNRMRPIHPGEILKEEFLVPMGLTGAQFAKAIHVTAARVYEIISGSRSISADTALRFSHAFGTTPEMWMNMQMAYDLRCHEINVGDEIAQAVHLLPQQEAELG